MDHYGFTPAQEMFLRHGRTGRAEGVLDVTTWFAGHIDRGPGAEAMSRAVCALLRRHEVLRLRLARDGDALVQHFESGPDDEIVRWCDGGAGALRAIDIDRTGPLAVLIEPDHEGRGALAHVGLHHLAYDGWSLATIKRELSALYAACVAGTDPADPPPVSYASLLPRTTGPSGLDEARLGYWKSQLRGARPWRLPRRGVPASTGLAVRPIPGQGVGDFASAARRLGEPPSVLLIGAAVLACAAVTGDDEVTLSHLYGGRGPSTPPVVGPLGLRQIYLRQGVPRDEDLGTFLRRLHTGWLGGILRSEPPYSAPRLFRMLDQGNDFAYLGDSTCVGGGEVVVNVSGSVGHHRRGATDEITWFGGGGAMATHSAAPLLIDADLGAFEESLRVHWRTDVHAAADVERYLTALTQVVAMLQHAESVTPVAALVSS
ncbi:hypothetical protein ABT023_17550 [Micromonospora sp. NPDC002296]|uniref:hypothetical protein n=1 Tax=Micromonospora sp. NPDC002296 TaxID=3154271 RepID=UPI00331C278D